MIDQITPSKPYYFKKVSKFIEYLELNGVPKGIVNAVSMGDNGFYLFWWNGSVVKKTRIGCLGVGYSTTNDADEFIKVIL